MAALALSVVLRECKQMGTAPVSYTHLDVYKRQELHGLTEPQEELEDGRMFMSMDELSAELDEVAHMIARQNKMCIRDRCFDVCYYLDYCRNLSDEEVQEQIPLVRQSELFHKAVSVFRICMMRNLPSMRCFIIILELSLIHISD